MASAEQQQPAATRAAATRPPSSTEAGWFTIPAPLARLFKKFPLLTYPPNELPARSPQARDVATLYVFVSDNDALKGLPSFNPSCLRWQTFLRLAGVDCRIVSSNNHASPTGALPFLIPASSSSSSPQNAGGPTDLVSGSSSSSNSSSNNNKKAAQTSSLAPVTSGKLEQYALDRRTATISEVPSHKLEAYQALLEHRIRNAWLYALYLSPSNAALLSELYIAPASASPVVRTTLLYQLRHAAESEITKSTGSPAVRPSALYAGVKQAFESLATVLGDGDWFFGTESPSIFDATVFSYTHLILDEALPWEDRTLAEIVKEFPALVAHRDRIYQRCWGSQAC